MRTKILEDFFKKLLGSERRREGEAFHESYALLRVIFDQAFQLMGLLKPDGASAGDHGRNLQEIGPFQAFRRCRDDHFQDRLAASPLHA
ncbi:MAG: hypothetical protein NDI77_12590 [Geobacteraceae bacterium]|nr:hypothetical protein [Geobacteraceae bacterium]